MPNRMIAAAALAMLPIVALSQTPAGASPMEFGCPEPGTRFTMDNGRSITAVSQVDSFCRMQRESGHTVDVYGLMYVFDEARKLDPAWKKVIDPIRAEKIFPLPVGKSHRGTAMLDGLPYAQTYKVLSEEILDTPMGPEPVFLVEMAETSPHYWARQKYWISPKHRYVLKFEGASSWGSGKFHVTRITPPAK